MGCPRRGTWVGSCLRPGDGATQPVPRLGTLPLGCSGGSSGLTALPCPLELSVSLRPFKDETMNRGFLQSSELNLGTFFPAWGASSSIQHHPLPWLGFLWLSGDPSSQLPETFLSWQVISCFRGSYSLLLKLLHFNHRWLKANESGRKVCTAVHNWAGAGVLAGKSSVRSLRQLVLY